MRILSLLLSVLLSTTGSLSYADGLTEQIDALIEKQLPQATVGVLVKDIQTGKVIYSKNATKLLAPASSIKLFTTAAAFYQLQPNYHFITSLSQKNKDFYLTFSGSPSLTKKNLTDLLGHLKKKGVTSIEGNFVIDSGLYLAPKYPGGISYDDLGWYYAAPVTTVIVNENAERYDFIPGEKAGVPVQIKAKSPTNSLTLINELKTVSKEEAKNHCALDIDVKNNNTLRLYGCMAVSKQPRTMELAVPNPELLVKNHIKKILADNGIILKGSIITGHTPANTKIIAQFQSPDLLQLIKHMLKISDNLYANSLIRQLGFRVTNQGSQKQGVFAMKKILAEHTHLDMKQVELADGMGTRYNLTTPEQMVILLQDLYQDKTLGPVLLSLLPQAGASGTLQDRMKKTILEGKVFAKTGTMHDISSLSGFLINASDKTLVFSILINGVNQPISKAKALEDQILLAVAKSFSKELPVN